VTGIEHGGTGVSVKYREAGQEKKLDADYLVCAMSAVMLRRIPITPNWSAAKEFVVKNMPYYIQSRVMFQARTPFWKRENISPNIEFGDGSLHFTWQMADEVETSRALLVATADATTTPAQALVAFRRLYPGKSDDIERAHVYDWAQETWTRVCETVHYPVGWMKKMWPATIEPEGRIHFVGAYADNLNWGMEAGTRSANRVAEAIDRA
jgi:monoamine oxidase